MSNWERKKERHDSSSSPARLTTQQKPRARTHVRPQCMCVNKTMQNGTELKHLTLKQIIEAEKHGIRDIPHLLTVSELADYLKVKKSWVYGHIHCGDLPFEVTYVGRYPRFTMTSVLRYLESQAVKGNIA